jgi:hypothetical protein
MVSLQNELLDDIATEKAGQMTLNIGNSCTVSPQHAVLLNVFERKMDLKMTYHTGCSGGVSLQCEFWKVFVSL